MKPIHQSWWWFDEANARHKKCDAALAWETARRTKSYQALWRKAERERNAFLGNAKAAKCGDGEQFRLMHLFQRERQAIPEPHFRFLMNGFDDKLTWLELSESQQVEVQQASLPRQRATSGGGVSVGLYELGHDAAGKLRVSKLIRGGGVVRCAEGTDFFRQMKLPPGQYLFASFDTCVSPEQLMQEFDRQMECGLVWCPVAGLPDPRARSAEDSDKPRVIPSADPPFAILILSARNNRERFRSAFSSQLKGPQMKRWHQVCVTYWKTVMIEVEVTERNTEGCSNLDSRGFPVRRKELRPLFNPTVHLPPKAKAKRPATRADSWLGLAAYDVVLNGGSLFDNSVEVKFLLPLCEKLDTKVAHHIRRKMGCHELRNHARSAEKRVKELDDLFGRLDKTLAHWIGKNRNLAEAGFFAAAAKPQR